jgi:hypothetical protein
MLVELIVFWKLVEVVAALQPGEHVFARDKLLSDGKLVKQFVKGTPEEIRRATARLHESKEADFYEMILTPDMIDDAACRFFLDMEYVRTLNPDAPSDEDLLGELLPKIRTYIKKLISRVDTMHTQVLTAHSDSKFSVHVIIRLFDKDGDEIWFADNYSVGAVVRRFEYDVMRKELSHLYFKAEKHKNEEEHRYKCVIDPGVNTANRQFRLVGNGKQGNDRPLLLNGEPLVSAEVWRSLMIQDYEVSKKLCISISEMDGSPAGGTSKFYEDGSVVTKKRVAPGVPVRTQKRRRVETGTVGQSVVDWLSKKFPGVRIYIQDMDEDTVTLFTDSTECPFRGQAHKSNKTFFWCKITQDVQKVTQDCFDEDCRALENGYRKNPPKEIPIADSDEDHAFRMQLMIAGQIMKFQNSV